MRLLCMRCAPCIRFAKRVRMHLGPRAAGITIDAGASRARQIIGTPQLLQAAAVHAATLSWAADRRGFALTRAISAWELIQALAHNAPKQLAAALPMLPQLAKQALTASRQLPPPRRTGSGAHLPKDVILGHGCASCACGPPAGRAQPGHAIPGMGSGHLTERTAHACTTHTCWSRHAGTLAPCAML